MLLEREEIRRNPGSAADVFRALDVLPGVISTGEFSSFAVRGSWSASATYSYSRARRDDKLGEGEFAADWDRPHALGIVGAWQPSDRWTFSAKWKYASGRPTDAFVVNSDVLGDASREHQRP